MKKIFLMHIVFLYAMALQAGGQSFSINTDGSVADASAMLDVKSTVKGLLIPRMSSAQRTAIGLPATGLQVYDTDQNQFYFYNGSVWTTIPTGANANNYWTLSAGNIYNNTGTNVGVGLTNPADKLEVNGNIRLSGSRIVLASPSTTGSANSITIRAGDPYIPVGGSGGTVNILATNNMPSGGSGYGNLGPSGDINLTAGSGYNTGGGHVNITAGATSCWAVAGNSHADVNLQGGANLSSADAASINLQGGGTVGIGCPTVNTNGGNLILRSGIGTGTGAQGNIQLLNGNVGIGTSAPTQKLHVVGNICYTGSIVACSDIRYKTEIHTLKNSLNKLVLLEGVSYFWKTSAYSGMDFSDRKQIGFIAQDLEKIFPEMVFTDDKGYKSIDYSRLTPVLVETIKEQQRQITEISSRLMQIEKLLNNK